MIELWWSEWREEYAGFSTCFGRACEADREERIGHLLCTFPKSVFPHLPLAATSLLPIRSPSKLLKCIIIVATQFSRRRSSIQSEKRIIEADCGSDNEIFIAKFRLKLKKVGKTTRPFRYGLNQMPYYYTVEVTNRFKWIDLIECLKNYGQRFVTLYMRQWAKPSQRKRNAKRQNGCLRRPYE